MCARRGRAVFEPFEFTEEVGGVYANSKTSKEIGFLDVLSELNPRTPFGKKRAAEARPFTPGDEALLESEFDRLQRVCEILVSNRDETERIERVFAEMKDISRTFARCGEHSLSTVELFEVKVLLLQMRTLRRLCEDIGHGLPDGFTPQDTDGLLDALDPEGGGIPVFYIYDLFSEKLAALRRQKKEKEGLLRAEQRRLAEETRAETGIALTPKYEVAIARSDEAAMEAAKNAPQLRVAEEDLFSVSFTLAMSDLGLALGAEIDALALDAEEEEDEVRKILTGAVAAESARLLENCERIGKLDFLMAKAAHALKHACVRPTISRNHVLHVEEGRHLQTERALREKGLSYRPVSIALERGVSCITGANMGGKTVSMKLAGLVAAMTRHGLFVPCASATVGLSSSISILIGDDQDVRKGLSGFGSEMERLSAILSESAERALILIDEIAGATNPAEGRALTKSLIAYLSKKPYITLMTTHFDHVAGDAAVANYRVRGLSRADLRELATALRDAGPGERLEAIAKLMDYGLERVSGEKEIPKDAIRIAEILGIDKEITDLAKRFADE
jgi:dsDNA-specific endonuclease/ATPase MutS2